MRVQSLGWEDPLEESRYPSQIFLPGESPWTEEPSGLQSMGVTKSETQLKHLRTQICTIHHHHPWHLTDFLLSGRNMAFQM